MDSSIFAAAISVSAAVISAGSAIVVSGLTSAWTKRREHESDWRRMKVEQYKEFIAALSGIVGSRSTREAQVRYADAVNSLTLVASPGVLKSMYRFQDEISYLNNSRTGARSDSRHDELLSELLNAIRLDIQPGINVNGQLLAFRLMDVPPPQDQLTKVSKSSEAVGA